MSFIVLWTVASSYCNNEACLLPVIVLEEEKMHDVCVWRESVDARWDIRFWTVFLLVVDNLYTSSSNQKCRIKTERLTFDEKIYYCPLSWIIESFYIINVSVYAVLVCLYVLEFTIYIFPKTRRIKGKTVCFSINSTFLICSNRNNLV